MTKNPQYSADAVKAAKAFAKGLDFKGARVLSIGHALCLHDAMIVARGYPSGKPYISFCMQGWPTQITVNHMNAAAKELFGEPLFFRKKGKVFFGPGLLREVDPNEHIVLPEDYRPGATNERATTDRTADADPRQASAG